jgi:nicotinamidase-related amidase
MKHKNILSRKGAGLVIVDMQEKLAPVIPGFDGLVTTTTKLILTFQMFDMPIIVTEQYPQGLGGTVEKLRKQFAFLEIIEKIEFSALDNEQWDKQVNPLNLDTFVVCGVETHVCVNQTVHALLARGATVHVVADAVGSRHPRDNNISLRKMELSGAIITTAETCMFELAERAGTDSFKNIQLMVKGPKKKVAFPQAAPGPGSGAQKGSETTAENGEQKTDEARQKETAMTPAPSKGPEQAPRATTAIEDTVTQEALASFANGTNAPVEKEVPDPKEDDAAPEAPSAFDAMPQSIDKEEAGFEPMEGLDATVDKEILDLENLLNKSGDSAVSFEEKDDKDDRR